MTLVDNNNNNEEVTAAATTTRECQRCGIITSDWKHETYRYHYEDGSTLTKSYDFCPECYKRAEAVYEYCKTHHRHDEWRDDEK